MIGGYTNDFTQKDDVIATVMLRIGPAFQTRCASRQNGHAAFTRFEFHPLKLVRITLCEPARQGGLILPQDMNAEVLGCLECFEVTR